MSDKKTSKLKAPFQTITKKLDNNFYYIGG